MQVEEFVPDPRVAKELGVTLMTLWRWSNDPAMGFPPAIKINTRNYRCRRAVEDFKVELMKRGIAAARNTEAES